MDGEHGGPGVRTAPRDHSWPGWRTDLAWQETFRDAMMDASVVSFDVFDTAITRIIDSPTDVFAHVERDLVTRFGVVAHGFASHREESEIEARADMAANGEQEVSLDRIYARLGIRSPSLAPLLEAARILELEAETALCRGVPDIQAAYALAAAAGKRVVFVSDMYLPGSFVRTLLTRCGYGDMPALLISSETGQTKGHGGMWHCLTRLAGPPEQILHVGDDDWADRYQPAAHGLRALSFLRVRSDRRWGAAPGPAVLPFSFAQRHAVLASRQILAETDSLALKRIGQVLGGITLGAFLQWLERRVARCGIDRLYFCARDGWLLHEAWKAAGLGQRTGVNGSYLRVSRWPLHLARGHVEGGGQHVTPALQRFLIAERLGLDLRTVLQRARLLGDPLLVAAAMRAIGPLDTVLATRDAFATVQRVIQQHPESVLAMAAQEYQALAAYLDQEGFGHSHRPAIVDLGWHGTMQASLASVLRASGRLCPLTGFYYALWPQASGQRPAAGWMEAAFVSDFSGPGEQRPLQLAADMLEELHGAPDGSVQGYRQEMGVWCPVLADNPAERAAWQAITRPFQEGALETVQALFATGRSGPLALADLTPETAVAALRAMLLSPADREVAVLGNLVHCRETGHAAAVAMVAPAPAGASLPALQEEINERGWPAGVLCAWRDAADGPGRMAVQAIARNVFHPLPERCLRQFG